MMSAGQHFQGIRWQSWFEQQELNRRQRPTLFLSCHSQLLKQELQVC